MATPIVPGSCPLNGRTRTLLPTTGADVGDQVTCYNYLGKPKTHDNNQRYFSSTTGVCRRLVVQAVNPNGQNEKRIKDHADPQSKRALWLSTTNPLLQLDIWVFRWLCFILHLFIVLKLFLLFLILLQDSSYFSNDFEDQDSDLKFRTLHNYKHYMRQFRRQLWAARSPKEYSKRTTGESIPTHSLRPRLLMIRDPHEDRWSPCNDPATIAGTKFVAISYCAADMNFCGTSRAKEDFIREVRTAVVQQEFDRYWLDLECLGQTPEEKNLDVYCMADVYRGADITLIMLGEASEDAWKHWGGRVWTLPEALLSQRLYYKFRRQSRIYPVSLHQLGNLAYEKYDLEQAIINAYSKKDPLERLERLTLLKSAIWRRGITSPNPQPAPSTIPTSGPYLADRVYALMGFFEHRIQPDHLEDNLRALARLSMANDNDRIVERMVSLLPSRISATACWYADDDVYAANLWDVVPEIQVAGITESGAVVLDGCKAACIRWKDFPKIAYFQADSVRRTLMLVLCYSGWLWVIAAGFAWKYNKRIHALAFVVLGSLVLLASPWLFVYSKSSRVISTEPWLIGVKGVLELDEAAVHLYGGIKGRYRRLDYTPSGSEFAVPEQGQFRDGGRAQYDQALAAERGPHAGHMYTLIDTHSCTIYYFCAQRAPTVCLFTGREGGLGRFVLCSERCMEDELHKETVLRMPTYISHRMELCNWVALG